MKKCNICGEDIVLVPSAAERSRKDVTGNPPSYYTNLFTSHSDCYLAKRDGIYKRTRKPWSSTL